VLSREEGFFVFRTWVLVLFILSFNAKSMSSMGAVLFVLPGGTASPRERLNKPPSPASSLVSFWLEKMGI